MYLANFQMFVLYYSHDKNDDVQNFTRLEIKVMFTSHCYSIIY